MHHTIDQPLRKRSRPLNSLLLFLARHRGVTSSCNNGCCKSCCTLILPFFRKWNQEPRNSYQPCNFLQQKLLRRRRKPIHKQLAQRRRQMSRVGLQTVERQGGSFGIEQVCEVDTVWV